MFVVKCQTPVCYEINRGPVGTLLWNSRSYSDAACTHVHRCRGGPDTHMWNYVVCSRRRWLLLYVRTYVRRRRRRRRWVDGETVVAVHSCCHGGHRFFDGRGGCCNVESVVLPLLPPLWCVSAALGPPTKIIRQCVFVETCALSSEVVRCLFCCSQCRTTGI